MATTVHKGGNREYEPPPKQTTHTEGAREVSGRGAYRGLLRLEKVRVSEMERIAALCFAVSLMVIVSSAKPHNTGGE